MLADMEKQLEDRFLYGVLEEQVHLHLWGPSD